MKSFSSSQGEIHSVQTAEFGSNSIEYRGYQGDLLPGNEAIPVATIDIQGMQRSFVVGQTLDLSEHHVSAQRRYHRVFLHVQ